MLRNERLARLPPDSAAAAAAAAAAAYWPVHLKQWGLWNHVGTVAAVACAVAASASLAR